LVRYILPIGEPTMSIVINTKYTNKKPYYYVYVVYGEGNKEIHYIGSAKNPISYEKALYKVKEILKQEMQKKLHHAETRAENLKNEYLSK